MLHHNLKLYYVGDNEIEHVFICLLVSHIPSLTNYILKTFAWFSMSFSCKFIAIVIFEKGTLIMGAWW